MNPWWRRPAANEGPARAEPKRSSAPDAGVQQEEAGQSEESAGKPVAQVAVEEVEASAAEESAPAAEASSLLVDAEASPAGGAEAGVDEREAAPDAAAEEDVAREADAADGEDPGGAGVSPALEAATEPAQPAQAAPADEDKPAPARRRRRRRGGRGRGRSAESGGESSAATATRTAPAGPPAASPSAAGRAAVLLDLGALKRSLEATSGLDPEGLFARLDGDLGKLVLRRVYADARDHDLDRTALHRGGVEVVDVPSNMEERGCSAAVRIVVDALELCYTKPGVNTMVLVASSVQMLPLVAKLQQNGVTVIGLGGADANAQVRGQCDRFIDLGG